MASKNPLALASEFKCQEHPLLRIWQSMLGRCLNKNHKSYHHYGGKGVKITQEWRSFWGFASSIEHSIGVRPSKKHTLDRIDSNGDYEPSNVRWATQKEQLRNQSRNVVIEFNGKSQCLSAWADEVGISYASLFRRISYLGWPIDKALTAKKFVRLKAIK